MELKKSLPPVINSDSRILILGSMPGEESLRMQQYYAHPRNHFWKIIAALAGTEDPVEYRERIEMLLRSGIALWDVIESCSRRGSLDTDIRNEVPNRIDQLVGKFGGIRAVFFNGRKAADSFRRSTGFDFLAKSEIDFSVLPSSSPANTIGFDRKLNEWMIIAQKISE